MTFQHARPDEPATVDRAYLDQLVQLNVRIPLQIRIQLDQFIDYRAQPPSEQSEEASNWPITLQELVQQALKDFLAAHPIKARRGPKPKPPRPPVDLSTISPKKGGE